MKAYLVDTMAEPIVRAQFGRMLVCIEAENDRFGTSRELAERCELSCSSIRSFALERLHQRSIGGEDVIIF